MALNGHRQRLQSQRLQIANGPPQSHEHQAWEASATARFQYTSNDNTQTSTERVNHLVSELLSAAHDIVARHRLTDAEYDALKARLTQVGDAERRSVLDVIVEHVIEAAAHTNRQGSKGGGIGPSTMAEVLRAGTVVMDHECSPDRVLATVLFTDVVDSTRHAAELGDRNWLDLLERHDDLTRTQIVRFGGHVVRHTGDGAVAIFDGPSRAVQSAAALSECIAELGIGIRCGLHTGECELRGDDIGGIAVHTGARIAALAHAGEVLVSNTVKDLVNGSGITFHDRGTHELKGVPGQWRLFACG
jgi:class 3 adenylate cyclase